MGSETMWSEIEAGTLNDADLKKLGSASELFIAGFEPDAVKQCYYEFSIGDEYVELYTDERTRLKKLENNEELWIPPRSSIVVKLSEKLRLPADCLARFSIKGSLFSVGIVPVNTHADPGFQGNMGVVLHNCGTDFIKLTRGQRVAIAEFEKLLHKVEDPYHGSHGWNTSTWPILAHLLASPDEVRERGIRTQSPGYLQQVYGQPIAQMQRSISYYSVVVWAQLALALAFVAIALLFAGGDHAVLAICLGIAANIVTAIILAIFSRTPIGDKIENWLRRLTK